jgi:hypothetical protein
MRTALFHNEPVDLPTFMRLIGQTEPKKINARIAEHPEDQPVCSCCGQPVHVYDTVGALGFRQARAESTHKRAQPGFHHKDINGENHVAIENCYHSFRDDERFHMLRDGQFDIRYKEAVHAALFDPFVRHINQQVIGLLMGRLTGQQKLVEADRQKLWKDTQRLLTWKPLAHFPWLLPYILVMIQGEREREFIKNIQAVTTPENPDKSAAVFKSQVAYQAVGSQRLDFTELDIPKSYDEGKKRYAIVPRILRPSFINRNAKGRVRIKPMQYGRNKPVIEYVVSKEAWLSMAPSHTPPSQEPPQKPAVSQGTLGFINGEVNLPKKPKRHGPMGPTPRGIAAE